MLQQLKVSIKWTDIQQQWSDTTLTLTPPTRPFIYHHHSHSLASTFPLSLSEQHKEFFLPYFVPNLRSFYASLRLTPVCSLLSSPRFMDLAFSSLLPPSLTYTLNYYPISSALPVFLNFGNFPAFAIQKRGHFWQLQGSHLFCVWFSEWSKSRQ